MSLDNKVKGSPYRALAHGVNVLAACVVVGAGSYSIAKDPNSTLGKYFLLSGALTGIVAGAAIEYVNRD